MTKYISHPSTVVERFAPSPTGYLHLGHAFSALTAWKNAQKKQGRLLIRFDDLDESRCKPIYFDAILEDLKWLQIEWEEPALLQSHQRSKHFEVIKRLDDMGLLYRCQCSRADIKAAIGAPQEGDDVIQTYPGTCREKNGDISGPFSLRFNMDKAIDFLKNSKGINRIKFLEEGSGPQGQSGIIDIDLRHVSKNVGDFVLLRRDGVVAYHLAVVIDDFNQGISTVTRGADLFESTHIHRIIQSVLDIPPPIYRHHKLIRDRNGKRLAKRHDALSIAELRRRGVSVQEIKEMAGFIE